MEKKTPLYDAHVALGGRMTPFAGYLLPVQYSGVIAEHRAVRGAAGLFDVSHMGEFLLTGPGACETLNYILTNDFRGMRPGRARYSPMCNENGGALDDMLVYCLAEDRYLIVVNAANIDSDAAWFRAHLRGGAVFENRSEDYALIALQGPESDCILRPLASALPEAYYTFIEHARVRDVDCLISRTGYTGEDGFELYCAPADAVKLWDMLLRAGEKRGLIPCGLGARDTLRLEAAMPLYGHELDAGRSPLGAGLHFAVKMGKDDFIGKDAMASEPDERLTGLKVTGRGIAREGCAVRSERGEAIGVTTSGTHCPFLDGAYAMAYIRREYTAPGTRVLINVRGRSLAAEVTALPFYKKSK